MAGGVDGDSGGVRWWGVDGDRGRGEVVVGCRWGQGEG